MPDDYQIEIPNSFIVLYTDARHRLSVPLRELRDRYEICEDLANHLTEHCRSIHVEIGVDEQEVLSRCQKGLTATPDDAVVSTDEALWVVTRLAELLGWPHPGLDGQASQQ
ncbi:MAG: hypothetical protein Q7U09_15370 [Hydrogenophaga sp.]|nr:hypothetical protein [Hydrogenophaga sp.]